MTLYSIDKLIAETRRLAAEFRRTTGTMLPVSGEIARYDVSHHLELTLNNQQVAGIDAIANGARQGQRIQIKSRVVVDSLKSGHRVGQFNLDGDWDIVVLSLMDGNFEPYEMYAASREEIVKAIAKSSANRNKRGAVSVAKFKIIGQLVWTPELGIEHNIWDHPESF